MDQPTTYELDTYADATVTPMFATPGTRILYLIPPSLMKYIKNYAKEMATISCKITNLNEKKSTLEANLRDSIIPNFLEYKYKKLFTQDHETNLRAHVIRTEIEYEINKIKDKILEIETIYNARHTTLHSKVGDIITNSGFKTDDKSIADKLDYEISCFRIQFLLKQQSDKTRKEAKKAKFEEAQELNNLEVTLKNSDLKKFKSTIQNLQDQVKMLSLNQKKQGNARGAAKLKHLTVPKTNPKKKNPNPTGKPKKSDGDKRNTVKNRKSPGKNGKQ